ncbi:MULTISPECIES: hypothetical protein [Streptomycetaceae]|uniref:hypothetical protein n=1 Tax=Streptomycetaceae TaxID=2062 RepID=UPI00093B2602|nr:hypothetical protein [Streptomyces sp. CB02056]OKI06938.1 hypothetical protein AMK13_16205 [Streptomyces sp. CB02056]
MPKSPRRFTAAATVCAALISAVGLLAPTAQAQARTGAPASVLAAPDAETGLPRDTGTPPGTEGQSTTVTRPDGTQARFAVFSTDYATGQTIWYRTQSAPGGPFGAWSQVNGMSLNFQNLVLTAAADADGALEVFTIGYQSSVLVRIHQAGPDGPWSAPEPFGPAGAGVPRFFGPPVAFQRADGTLAFFEVYQGSGSPRLYVNEQSAPGVWGSWNDLGSGPLPAGVATPSSVTQSADGRLTVLAHMWNATSWTAQISEQAPGGPWGPWQDCRNGGCAAG